MKLYVKFIGQLNTLPNHTAYALFEFGDGQTLNKQLSWTALDDNTGYYDVVTYTYNSYGSYHTQVTLTNNVSQLTLTSDIEIEQCVEGFAIDIDKNG